MPNPTAPPTRAETTVPDNLDQLVRDALAGRTTARSVRQVLSTDRKPDSAPQANTTPLSPTPAPAAAPPLSPVSSPAVVAAHPRPAPAASAAALTAPQRPSAQVTPTQGTTFADLSRLAVEAERADTAGDSALARDLLAQLAAGSAELLHHSEGSVPGAVEALPPAPVTIPLPPFRHPFALVLGPGEATLEAALAEALEVDLATARALCGSRHGRVALRGADLADLERKAAAARKRGIAARAFARTDLLALPAAEAVVGKNGDGWLIWPQALWLEPSEPDRQWPVNPSSIADVFLLVPGEVEVRTTRETSESSRWLRKSYSSDKSGATRRISVLDLHLPGRILRFVEGVTDTREFPQADPASSLRTLRAFPEHAPRLWPDVVIEGRRVCPAAPASPSDPPAINGTGWAAWEEHSRAARILYS